MLELLACMCTCSSPPLFLQKIYENSYISMQNHSGLLRMVNAAWSSFLLRGLGLIPIDGGLDTEIELSSGAFELLRVRVFQLFRHSDIVLTDFVYQIRNRFAASNPPGGYRDINIKIRVGFKSDANTGRPLFCPVYVHFCGLAALCVSSVVRL